MTASHSPILDYDSSDEYRPEPVPQPQAPAWRDGSVRIGIHTSIAGRLCRRARSGRKAGLQRAADFFGQSAHVAAASGARIAEMRRRASFAPGARNWGSGPLVIHANYLINLASSDPVMRVRSIQAFHDEMLRGAGAGRGFSGGSSGLAAGKGRGLGRARQQAIRDVAQALRQAARGMRLCGAFDDRAQTGGLRLLLENTSGMGMAVGCALRGIASDYRRRAGSAAGHLPGHGARLRGRLRNSHRSGTRARRLRRSTHRGARARWPWCT